MQKFISTCFLACALLALAPGFLPAQPKLQLTDFASGFTRPVDIAHHGDSRLYVVEQAGKIWILDSLGARVSPEPFLDIDPRVNSTGNEQGLLGLAFHANYRQNGLFYVHYTISAAGGTNGDTRVARFQRDSLDENKADPNSEKILLAADQPYTNHNGGCLKFGPDGMLYIGLGDGGSGGDPDGNGQKQTFLGKILRIDVDGGDPYAVPPTNPFVNDPAYLPEIWHTGLRNPWRISFDRLTGDLWIGDVGQNAREEIDFQPAGVGGYNFGWRCYEGTNTYNTSGCGAAGTYRGPAFQYANPSIGCSVTGGFVYRGAKYADLYGSYIFTDYCSGRWWTVRPGATTGVFEGKEIANLNNSEYSSLGEGHDGELYVCLLGSGKIQRITELCSPFQISANVNDECAGNADGAIELTIENPGGLLQINWQLPDGSTTASEDLDSLGAGTYVLAVQNPIGCVREGAFTVENQSPEAPFLEPSSPWHCAGTPIELTVPAAPAGFGYQWLNGGLPIAGAVGQSINVSETGVYQAVYTGQPCRSNLSNGVDMHIVSRPQPTITVNGNVLTSSLPGDWFFNGVYIPGASGTGSVTATVSGTYSVSVTIYLAPGWGSCTGGASVQVTVVDAPMPLEVQSFDLAPNPAPGGEIWAELLLAVPQKVQFQVSDVSGKMLRSVAAEGKKIRQALDLTGLPAGTYFLTVEMGTGRFVRGFVRG